MISVYYTVYRLAQIHISESSLADLVGFNSNSRKIVTLNDHLMFCYFWDAK